MSYDTFADEMTKIGAAKKMKILTIGREAGHGHIAQARNLARAAEQQGVEAEVVDLHGSFGTQGRKRIRDFGRRYDRMLRGKAGLKDAPGLSLSFLRQMSLNKDKVQRFGAENEDAAIVTTYPMARHMLGGLNNPLYVYHTDQVPWPDAKPGVNRLLSAVKGADGPRIHVGEKKVVGPIRNSMLEKEKVISVKSIPVSERVLRPTERPKEMPQGRYNVTVSGGGLGLDVTDAARSLLESGNLPNNALVHAVAGKSKKVKRQLEGLKKQHGDKLQVWGFAPLPAMMAHADLNVLRAHGTSVAESLASGTPSIFFSNKPKSAIDMQAGLTTRTALSAGSDTGYAVARTPGELGDALNDAIRRKARHTRRAQTIQRGLGDPSAEAVTKIMRDFSRRGR